MADDLETRVETLDETMRRVLGVIDALAAQQARIDNAVMALLEAQMENERRFKETDERFRRTDQRLEERSKETDERFRRTDERIAHLVSAIGELVRQWSERKA